MAISVVLDASVLYPIGLRDTLLNIAEAGCFRVLWTEEILAETSRNIVEDTPGLTPAHLEKTFAAMRRALPEVISRDGLIRQHLLQRRAPTHRSARRPFEKAHGCYDIPRLSFGARKEGMWLTIRHT